MRCRDHVRPSRSQRAVSPLRIARHRGSPPERRERRTQRRNAAGRPLPPGDRWGSRPVNRRHGGAVWRCGQILEGALVGQKVREVAVRVRVSIEHEPSHTAPFYGPELARAGVDVQALDTTAGAIWHRRVSLRSQRPRKEVCPYTLFSCSARIEGVGARARRRVVVGLCRDPWPGRSTPLKATPHQERRSARRRCRPSR